MVQQLLSGDLVQMLGLDIASLQPVMMEYPHLLTPALLAMVDTNLEWKPFRHLCILDQELRRIPANPGTRLLVNMPWQHGKSEECSHYFPAWHLLLYPDTRILLISHEETFAESFGAKVKETIERFGKDLGVELRRDSKAKGEWNIAGHRGGMVCKGMGGSVGGRAADLIILEDPIKNPDQVMSPIISEQHWEWWNTVVWGRMRRGVSVVIVTTRWSRKDLPGRTLAQAKRTAEEWRVVKFKGIAGEDDILGRAPGEPLCPELKSLEEFEKYRQEQPRWFAAAVQQEPEEEENPFFRPDDWPVYLFLGNAYSLSDRPGQRTFVGKDDILIIVTVDWATSEKKSADYTAIGVFGLTPDGRLLVLEIVNKRLAIENCVPELASVCKRWNPNMVAVETGGFQTALALECRRHRDIPEVRRLEPEWGANVKIRRAVPAKILGENHRIYLPENAHEHKWYQAYTEQLRQFTGLDDEHDDMVDVTGYAAQMANELRPPELEAPEPIMLTPGYVDRWSEPS